MDDVMLQFSRGLSNPKARDKRSPTYHSFFRQSIKTYTDVKSCMTSTVAQGIVVNPPPTYALAVEGHVRDNVTCFLYRRDRSCTPLVKEKNRRRAEREPGHNV